MRILIINTFYFPNMVGGTENSVKILAENMVKAGHEVAVYCIDSNRKDIVKETINGVKIYRGNGGIFNIDCRLGKNKNIATKILNKLIELRNYSIKKEVEYLLDDFKPEIVHTNNIYGISPYIWKKINSKGIKIIHTVRDYWILSPKIEIDYGKNLVEKLVFYAYRKYFKNCSLYVDSVTAPSKFTLNIFKDNNYFANANFTHINNAIEIDKELVSTIINNRIENNDEIINFIFVGMLTPMKGIDKLLMNFKKYNNENIRLNICGEGQLLDMVEEYSKIDKRIFYKGKLDKISLIKELKLNDVIIVPSNWDEPFGRVVIEGNQYGLPVIGSNKGGIKEIVENINTGELFNINNDSEFSGLLEYFSDRKNIKKYYTNIEKDIHKYSIENQIVLFELEYNKNLK